MFDDNRSKKVVLLSHCLLNQNSISDGTADFPSQFREIIEQLMNNNIGIIQLPCPELLCLGLERGDACGAQRALLEENTRIRSLMSEVKNKQRLQRKAEELVEELQEYRTHGFKILGLIGVNRSPSCGIETTTRNGAEQQGQGVFIEVLREILVHYGITVPMTGTKTSEPIRSVEQIKQFVLG